MTDNVIPFDKDEDLTDFSYYQCGECGGMKFFLTDDRDVQCANPDCLSVMGNLFCTDIHPDLDYD